VIRGRGLLCDFTPDEAPADETVELSVVGQFENIHSWDASSRRPALSPAGRGISCATTLYMEIPRSACRTAALGMTPTKGKLTHYEAFARLDSRRHDPCHRLLQIPPVRSHADIDLQRHSQRVNFFHVLADQ
jgi:hypothetical protein